MAWVCGLHNGRAMVARIEQGGVRCWWWDAGVGVGTVVKRQAQAWQRRCRCRCRHDDKEAGMDMAT